MSGVVVQHIREERERASRKHVELMRENAERNERAYRAALAEFPHLRVGTHANPDARSLPCPWLVSAIANESRHGTPKRGRVLAERRRLLLARKSWFWEDVTVDPVTGGSLIDEEGRAAA